MKKSFHRFARFLSAVCLLFSAFAASHAASKNYLLYVGTYTNTVSAHATDEFLAEKPERTVPIPNKSGTAFVRKIAR